MYTGPERRRYQIKSEFLKRQVVKEMKCGMAKEQSYPLWRYLRRMLKHKLGDVLERTTHS